MMETPNRYPVAVLISDIHFTPTTLELASSALRQAQAHARRLELPLIIAGDILDTKAIIRAECANRLLEIFSDKAYPTILVVGNHDMLNEKGEGHALNFLRPYLDVVDLPIKISYPSLYLVPYFSDRDALQTWLDTVPPKGSTLIMHQGVQTAYLGHYVQDKTSLPPEAFKDFRVISGHYHRRQDIKCGPPRKGAVGLFSYLGNPYSLNFGEAPDGPKGFSVLMSDGLLEFVPTNLRKHVILEIDHDQLKVATGEGFGKLGVSISPEDLVWIKIRGPESELAKVKKQALGELLGRTNFKLDLLPTESEAAPEQKAVAKMTDGEVLDSLIESTGESEEQKKYLKSLWREVYDESRT